MDFLLFESEDFFRFSTVLPLLDDPSLLVFLHWFGVLDLELAELFDTDLQAAVLSSSRISFLEFLEAADSDF